MKIIPDFKKCFVVPSTTIKDALKVMDAAGYQIVLVTDEVGKLLGLVTDGDMRRTIIRSTSLSDSINSIMNRQFASVSVNTDKEHIRAIVKEKCLNHVPVLDEQGVVQGMYFRGSITLPDAPVGPIITNLVVVMAGGKGSRLDPFTRVLPKPMIPLGDKPVVEHIIDRFHSCGFINFTLSVNYKKEIIKLYFAENASSSYHVCFIEEAAPCGTAGSLSLLEGITETFVVTNCDIIIEADFRDILEFHLNNDNDVTIVGSLRHIKVPYGVIDLQDSAFREIQEKPEYDVLINTGLYYLEPDMLSLIPAGKVIDMPELIMLAKAAGRKIGVYPIYNSWHDVGEWDEYRKAISALGYNE